MSEFDSQPRYTTKRMHYEIDRAKDYGIRITREEAENLVVAGRHLAVKLAEVYRAAGHRPADCQAIREWMDALKGWEKR